jgi:hypothetical protein
VVYICVRLLIKFSYFLDMIFILLKYSWLAYCLLYWIEFSSPFVGILMHVMSSEFWKFTKHWLQQESNKKSYHAFICCIINYSIVDRTARLDSSTDWLTRLVRFKYVLLFFLTRIIKSCVRATNNEQRTIERSKSLLSTVGS